MEHAGILPGDVVTIDQSKAALAKLKSCDFVLARGFSSVTKRHHTMIRPPAAQQCSRWPLPDRRTGPSRSQNIPHELDPLSTSVWDEHGRRSAWEA